MSNLLSIKQDLSFFRAELKLSHSYTEEQQSGGPELQLLAIQAGFLNIGDVTKIDPKTLASKAVHDQRQAKLRRSVPGQPFQRNGRCRAHSI